MLVTTGTDQKTTRYMIQKHLGCDYLANRGKVNLLQKQPETHRPDSPETHVFERNRIRKYTNVFTKLCLGRRRSASVGQLSPLTTI